jgi:hypothetical protein
MSEQTPTSAPSSASSSSSSSQPSGSAPSQVSSETKKEKKPRSEKQLAALAKGREMKAQRASERSSKIPKGSVVRSDESALELTERIKTTMPSAEVKNRNKRKSHDTYEEDVKGGYGSTIVKVGAVAAVAGLAFLGLKNGGFSMMPISTPPSTHSSNQSMSSAGGAPNGFAGGLSGAFSAPPPSFGSFSPAFP